MPNSHTRYHGNCLDVLRTGLDRSVQLTIADPPYESPGLINAAIAVCREICLGSSFFFMYPEDLCDLVTKPDQVLVWTKPPSTKNTKRHYSRFVEAIAVYDLDRSPFNQDTYWFSRSGVFTDTPHTVVHRHYKPFSLIEKLVAVNSNPGDTVLDPFAGSHQVERVCRHLDRGSISIEVEP